MKWSIKTTWRIADVWLRIADTQNLKFNTHTQFTKNNEGFNYPTCGFSCQKSGYPAPRNWKTTKHVDSKKNVYPLNLTTKKLVPAPIATLRNLNIVQNGKSSFKGFKLLVFSGGPAFCHFGPLELWFSGPFILEKTRAQLSHKRHLIRNEVNFKCQR